MKKIILILISILIAVYIILSALGSEGEYAAEKLFYRAMKANSKILINPDVAPPALLASVENNLQAIVKRYPKSNTVKLAKITLAEFYISNKKYTQALSVLNAILDSDIKDVSLSSRAQFLKGIVYEKQNQWGKALKEFTTLRNKYANTELAIQMPLYIARYYETHGKQAEAQKAYDKAAVFYASMEKRNRGKVLGYVASKFLVQSYFSAEHYEEAGKAIENTIENYPSTITYMQYLPQVELIFTQKLNRPQKALEIYKNTEAKIKDNRLKKILNKKIEDLEKKK